MRFDLIIIGGGLVGAGLAAALHSSGLRMALIDARLPSNDDPRLFALNDGSCQFLKNLSVWPQLVTHATAIHQVHVSRQGRFGSVRLNHDDLHLSALGHVIPAKYIETALNEQLTTLSNVTVYRPARLQQLTQDDQEATLHITTDTDEKILHAPLVIGADGTESTVRKLLNIPADIDDYQQSALVTRTLIQRSHQHIAYERFIDNGAIAMLPLGENECATIWTADSAFIAEQMAKPDNEFLQILQKTFGYRLGRLLQTKQRHVFPLRLMKAEKMVEGCVCLIGNAAHTLHPIAAQGFNLAIYEVAALAEGMMQKISKQQPIDASDLAAMSTQTQQQQALSMQVSHRLATLFSYQSPLMSLAVQLGMVGLDIATPIKKKLMQGMTGRTGNVPPLLLSGTDHESHFAD